MTTININLLGIERKEALARKGNLPIDKGWLISVSCLVVALLFSFGLDKFMDIQVANAEETKIANEEKIKKLDQDLKEIADLEKKQKELETEEKILLYVTGETYRWSYLMEEMRALMPLDVKISNLKISAAGAFSLNGTAPDHRTVALFLISLQRSEMLQEVVLNSSDKTEDETTFVISCKVKAGS